MQSINSFAEHVSIIICESGAVQTVLPQRWQRLLRGENEAIA